MCVYVFMVMCVYVYVEPDGEVMAAVKRHAEVCV
jgi:hypothetical protein